MDARTRIPYGGDGFIHSNSNGNFARLSRQDWFPDHARSGIGAAFRAELSSARAPVSAVPEPASLALMLPGLGAVVLLKRRKKHAA